MSILEHLSSDFDSRIRQRGEEYFDQRRVSIGDARPGYIRAIVRGTGRYRVEIRWRIEEPLPMEFRCGCPYFEDWGVCKHLWATLRAAEKIGALPKSSAGTSGNGNGNGNGAAHDDEDDDWDLEESSNGGGALTRGDLSRPPTSPAPTRSKWLRAIDQARDQMSVPGHATPAIWPANRRVVYVVDLDATETEGALAIELMSEDMLPAGRADRAKPLRLSRSNLPTLPDETDAAIVQMLIGASRGAGVVEDFLEMDHRFMVPEVSSQRLLQQMIATGRCRLRANSKSQSLTTLTWDDSPPWQFTLRLERDPREELYWLRGDFRRGQEARDANDAAAVLRGGLMIRDGIAQRYEDGGAFALVQLVRGEKEVFVPEAQLPGLLSELFSLPRLPKLELPEGMKLEEIRATPRPKLLVFRPPAFANRFVADLVFDYAGTAVASIPSQPAVYDAATARLIWRDLGVEATAQNYLIALGLKFVSRESGGEDRWRIQGSKLSRIVSSLVAGGWIVEAEGKIYRRGGKFNVRVASGIDWFELHGGIDFGDQTATLPQLLTAIRSGDKMVQLGDGSFGVLPEDWLQQYGLLAAMGQVDGEHIKFAKRQLGLLDALLAALPDASWDDSFARLRGELGEFAGVRPIDAPGEFIGQLRPYQRDGLGWISFLRRFSFGGCLADDMGLGKTIQVLAMLQQRKADGVNKPSLVVVPRSLIFNWLSEAAKFTPKLKVVDHSGAQRSIPADKFASCDIVLSTYGTVRRDAGDLKDIPFDYVILDEAQAIKNNQSESAKAVRILKGEHRLALSGTPVQNHLGELWSLFEFLNPGLLGTAAAFRTISGSGNIELGARQTLSRVLRPFILRRTKQQVATDLPDKLEQTLVCELDREQRRLYNEMREHFRVSLLESVDRDGLNKNRMQILEALLRLRQAACHPGLIDKSRVDEPSAKLDALVPQLEEVIDEDHKVLVFSQFTSFLAILRKKLDARGIVYEYLDGKTTDRQKRVRRFQNDPECKLFLISLKAGGLGLNLTAAEYVFLLDPWWNPAVEQQAIDRTHRIGQTRQVFAYRLIARDTVEEKVLELQKQKRDLADAIITADNSLISKMGREELEMLLS